MNISNNGIKTYLKSDIAKVVAGAFVLALVVSSFSYALADLGAQNIEYTTTENGNPIPNFSAYDVAANGNKTFNWSMNITNHGPGGMHLVVMGFHDNDAGTEPTIKNPFNIDHDGKDKYAEGESGVFNFYYNTNEDTCGRVQIDVGVIDERYPDYHDTNIFAIIIDYGTDCTTPPLPPPPAPICSEDAQVTVTQALPATMAPGASAVFKMKVKNTGDTRWYHGSYFQFVRVPETSPGVGLQITPSYGHLPNGVYPEDEVIWEFTATAPTTSGSYSLDMQMVHRANAEYLKPDGTTCIAPTIDIYFGNEGTITTTVGTTNNSPTGYLDLIDCDRITGWAKDLDTPDTAVTVTFYADGTIGSGALLGSVVADDYRADVGNHAYSFPTPNSIKDGGVHYVYAYAMDTSGLAMGLVGEKSFNSASCTVPPPCTTGTIQVNSNIQNATYTISGPSNFNGAGAQTYANKPIGNYSISVADISGYTKTVTPTSGTLVCNGTLTFNIVFTPVSTNQLPEGYLDSVDCDRFSGWAKDPDSTSSVTVKFYADGTNITGMYLGSIVADQYRAAAGNYAYNFTTPSSIKDGGTHTIRVYTDDLQTSQTVLVGQNSFDSSVCLPPSKPIVVVPSCSSTNYSASISWTGTANLGYGFWVDISTAANFAQYWNKQVADGTQTTAPVGFNPQQGASGSLTLVPGIQYFVRVYNGSHSPIEDFQVNGCGNPNLSIEKTVRNVTVSQSNFVESANAEPGQTVEFRMQVFNNGDAPANNVVVTDVLPAHFTALGSLTSNLGNIAPGTNKVIILQAVAGSVSEFPVGTSEWTNTATASSANHGNVSDTAKVVVTRSISGQPSLQINKTVKNISSGIGSYVENVNALSGNEVEFRIEVVNNGSFSANNVTIADVLPNNFSANTALSFNVGTLNAGQNYIALVRATVASEGSFPFGSSNWINTATVSASNHGNVSDTASVTVHRSGGGGGGGGSTYLSINKFVRNLTASQSSYYDNVIAQSGDRVMFRITVSNPGSGTANNVRISDSLPYGLSYEANSFSIDGNIYYGNPFNGWISVGNLNSNDTRVITFVAVVNSSGTLTNVATATADNTGTVNDNASVSASQVAGGNINLQFSKKAYNITKNADATTVVADPKDVIVYTLGVFNSGNTVATNYTIEDDISDVLQIATLTDFGGGQFNMGGLSIKWQGLSIPANSKVEKTFSVTVKDSIPTNTDYVLSNTYGNTVNINVRRPQVQGIFVAPKTGNPMTMSLIFALLTLISFVFYKKSVFGLILKKVKIAIM